MTFLQKPEEGGRSSSTRAKGALPRGYWGLNLSPLQKHCIPLIAEPLLSPMDFLYSMHTDILPKDKGGLKMTLNMNTFIS